MDSLPWVVVLNVGLVVFVCWVIIWLITKTPPTSAGCASK